MYFSIGGLADFAGYLEGNQEICKRRISEKGGNKPAGLVGLAPSAKLPTAQIEDLRRGTLRQADAGINQRLPNMCICFFIGHRDTLDSVRPLLANAIERHIVQYKVTDFVVGDHGSFNRLAAQALKEAKKRHPEIRLTLLLAYYDPLKPIKLPDCFDDSLYPYGMERVPRHAAIVRANRYMIQHSQYLITYDAGKIGNTKQMVKYARLRAKNGLIIIENLADQI